MSSNTLLQRKVLEMRNFLRRLAGTPFVSIGLVGINVIVYVLNSLLKDLFLQMGNLNIYDVLSGHEYGRILWAMFLHADLNHLFNNMVILLFMGAMLEREAGHLAFVCIYMLSGLCGNISSLIYKLLHHSMSLSVGASGAVFGMDGLLLALVFFSVRGMPAVTPARAVIMIVLSLYNGFMSSNIDNAAHMGGLIAGFIQGCLLCIVQRMKYNIVVEKRYMR